MFIFESIRKRRSFIWSLGFLICFILAGANQVFGQNERNRDDPEASGGRLALVIGNGDYLFGRLRNPVNDARGMATALKKAGFEVIEVLDGNRIQMEKAIGQFGSQLETRTVGLFFFAGHGMQWNGNNFLIPVDAKISNSQDLEHQGVTMNEVLKVMEKANTPMNIIILDACRENPFRGSLGDSSGLAEMTAPSGSYIAFATKPGGVASDNPLGQHGLFTGTLLRHILTPDLRLVDLFMKVRQEVSDASNNTQVPWDSHALVRKFYFVGGPPTDAPSYGWLILKSLPEGAKWYLDGSYKGLTPADKVHLQVGSYNIRVTKENHEPWEDTILVQRDRSTVHLASLRKSEPEPEMEPGFTNSIGQELVLIPAGEFTMGSPETEPERRNEETPHRVRITKPFYLMATEVTQGQWKALMGRNPSQFPACGDLCPVENVSWNDVQKFIQKLNAEEGTHRYRLPTEAEWEYAARAGTTTPFAFGPCLDTDEANYNGTYPFVGCYAGCNGGLDRGKTIPVTGLEANAWGFHGMHGNVREWVQDVYAAYSDRDVTKDPVILEGGSDRVARGGSWDSQACFCRSASRISFEPDNTFAFLGFRLASDVETPSSRERKPGTLIVETEPPGAAVWLDGESRGLTPLEINNLTPKDFQLRITKAGYDDAEKTVSLHSGEPMLLPVKLEKKVPHIAARITNPLGQEFVLIPAGEFMMGSPETEPGRDQNEKQKPVRIAKPFFLMTTEVTQGQWKTVMGNNPSHFDSCGDRCPVEQVSWNDVQAFLKKLNDRTGPEKYRLPTEEEWEYAARAGTTTPFSFGNCLDATEGNFDGKNPLPGCTQGTNRNRTLPAAGLKANAWDLHDMHGNVWEWVQGDFFASSNLHVGRGGGWASFARYCRSASRYGYAPDAHDPGLGFRLARDADLFGSLKVETEPSGAAVWVNDELKGQTPCEIQQLQAGPCQVKATLEGYEVYELKTEVFAGQPNHLSIFLTKNVPKIEKKITNSIGQEFVLLPAGEFQMGSPETETGRDKNEPRHRVRITQPFYLMTTEVTQGQWEAVMGNNPSRFSSCGENCPVENVSWDDAREFIETLNAMEDTDQYRLPTEAEWEYAARAGTTTPFAFSFCLQSEEANYDGHFPLAGCNQEEFPNTTLPVASLKANDWDLHDMHGNVWEWVQDRYDPDAYAKHPVEDPLIEGKGFHRVLRGGDWLSEARFCRSANRGNAMQKGRSHHFGFRIAKDDGGAGRIQTEEQPKTDTGALKVTTDPSEATIWMDGEHIGRSPCSIQGLQPGYHLLRTTRDGFEDLEIQVKVKGNSVRTICIDLKERQ